MSETEVQAIVEELIRGDAFEEFDESRNGEDLDGAELPRLLDGHDISYSGNNIIPTGPSVTLGPRGPMGLPTTVSELPHQLARVYDLSVTAAAQLDIPIVGSVSGAFDRRVVVLERSAYKKVNTAKAVFHYGYAIRLGITVNKLEAGVKLSLPFLAASAELGRIEAKWMLQVIGLAGEEIDNAILPPQELNVETFVLAKQSLEKIIAAVHDSKTTFTATEIAVEKTASEIETDFVISIGRSYALGSLRQGRNLASALKDLDSARSQVRDAVTDTYRGFGGVPDESTKPSQNIRHKAAELLGNVRVEAK